MYIYMLRRFLYALAAAAFLWSCSGSGGASGKLLSLEDAADGDSNYVFTVNGVTFKMIRIHGGTFSMGHTFDQGVVRNPDIHQVYLDGYAIGASEVSQELWSAVMGGNPSAVKDPSSPVTRVTWKDAVKFTSKLTKLTGIAFRLPTEAEWEYAARQDASFCGGVWEWCSDWWRESWEGLPEINPHGPSEGSEKALRGNSSAVLKARPIDRKPLVPQAKSADTGFRLAVSTGEPCPESVLGILFNRVPREDISDLSVERFTVGGVSFRMMPVKGGTFSMGATEEQQKSAAENEKPVHEVTVSSFKIGEFEVTCELWNAVMGSLPPSMKGGRYPVGNVSWYDAQAFIAELNRQTGRLFRLPTEAEWEFAARGGVKSRNTPFAGSRFAEYVSVYDAKSTSVVGTKQPNELGLYDMSGNAWEWVQDIYGPYTAEVQVDPSGPDFAVEGNDFRVMRSGSAMSRFDKSRTSKRSENKAVNFKSNIGFRLAL